MVQEDFFATSFLNLQVRLAILTDDILRRCTNTEHKPGKNCCEMRSAGKGNNKLRFSDAVPQAAMTPKENETPDAHPTCKHFCSCPAQRHTSFYQHERYDAASVKLLAAVGASRKEDHSRDIRPKSSGCVQSLLPVPDANAKHGLSFSRMDCGGKRRIRAVS